MGWIKDAKATTMRREAQAAWDEDAVCFTPVLNFPALKGDFSGRVKDWEMMVAAILEVGWELTHWAVASDSHGRPQAMPYFTRSSTTGPGVLEMS